MTREELTKDLDNLKSQREQLIANINAVAGVINYIEQKLTTLDKPATDATPDPQ